MTAPFAPSPPREAIAIVLIVLAVVVAVPFARREDGVGWVACATVAAAAVGLWLLLLRGVWANLIRPWWRRSGSESRRKDQSRRSASRASQQTRTTAAASGSIIRLSLGGRSAGIGREKASGMGDFYVEFEVGSEEGYRRLEAVLAALAAAKRTDDFRDDAYWLAFFNDEERTHFWWPTEADLQEWSRRWQATPVDVRTSDPSFLLPAWDFGSMIDAFRDGDYVLLGCRRVSPQLGRLEFEPFGWPYGGTGCMRALIKAFGHRVTVDADA